jgi:exodeoxyribonuclease VII large subunit
MMTANQTVTVSEYASQIGDAVRRVGGAVIEGEIQKTPRPTRGGMLFFELSDGEATVGCKVFRREAARLQYRPQQGDLVQVVVDRPDFWTGAGELHLIVSAIKLAGEGELLRRRAELLVKLKAEGLCDPGRWKPLPRFPRAVGVIAGKDAHGRTDVIAALQDRFPPARIVCCDALVQGKAAPLDIIDAIAHLQQHPQVDVIVIARGGGSVQDLVAFDDERLCRAIFACDVPVVAAIGHTDNIPVCNHVTHAATTPSRSHELVVPSAAELRQGITLATQAIEQIPERISRQIEQTEALRERLRVPELIETRERDVRELGQRIAHAEESFFATRERGLAEARVTIAAIPHRAQAAIAEREHGLVTERPRLAAAGARVEDTCVDVARQATQVTTGIRRQLVDHERDYGHAFARLGREIKIALLRLVKAREESLEQHTARVSERVERGFDGAARELQHVSALIEARDFRSRGFVLATDEQGRPVERVAALRPGRRLNLNFRDGRAEAVVDTIKEESS